VSRGQEERGRGGGGDGSGLGTFVLPAIEDIVYIGSDEKFLILLFLGFQVNQRAVSGLRRYFGAKGIDQIYIQLSSWEWHEELLNR